MIKLNKGLEHVLVLFTGLREYRCRDCDEKFRAPDRRAAGRAVHPAPAPHRQTA
jgi:hypothetical protein